MRGLRPGALRRSSLPDHRVVSRRGPGWLCYNVHGLDDEGWGPLGSDTLDRLLEDLVARDVRVLPITAALDLAVA